MGMELMGTVPMPGIVTGMLPPMGTDMVEAGNKKSGDSSIR